MIEMTDKKKAKVIKANRMLQAKVGAGPLDEKTVEKCQEVIDNNTVDFAPMAQQYLEQLDNAVKSAKTGELSADEAVQAFTEPVMQLKANARVFGYTLIGNLANVMLSFLETVEKIDNDVIQIVEAHHKTLTAIVVKKMKGDGGEAGKQFEAELKNACQRYLSKK